MSLDEEDDVATLTRIWAEAVLRHVVAVRSLRVVNSDRNRQVEWAEEWSPSEEEVAQTWRELWAAEHTLVWAAYQMQRWTVRLAGDLRGDRKRQRIAADLDPSKDVIIGRLRNALEHMDEALFEDGRATAAGTPSGINHSLRALPGGEILLALGGSDELFGLVAPSALEQRANAVLAALDAESDAYTQYLIDQYLIDESRLVGALSQQRGGLERDATPGEGKRRAHCEIRRNPARVNAETRSGMKHASRTSMVLAADFQQPLHAP